MAPLVPVFLLFLVTHVFAILYALGTHVAAVGEVVRSTAADARAATG